MLSETERSDSTDVQNHFFLGSFLQLCFLNVLTTVTRSHIKNNAAFPKLRHFTVDKMTGGERYMILLREHYN